MVLQMKNNTTALFIIALICIIVKSSFAQAVPDQRPNILLIVADDLGYADLGCYGGEDVYMNGNYL
jgi:arylsulfatase